MRWYDVRSSPRLPLWLQSPTRGRSSRGPIPTLTTSFEKRTTLLPCLPTTTKTLAGIRVTRSGSRSREAVALPAPLGSRTASASRSRKSGRCNSPSLATDLRSAPSCSTDGGRPEPVLSSLGGTGSGALQGLARSARGLRRGSYDDGFCACGLRVLLRL